MSDEADDDRSSHVPGAVPLDDIPAPRTPDLHAKTFASESEVARKDTEASIEQGGANERVTLASLNRNVEKYTYMYTTLLLTGLSYVPEGHWFMRYVYPVISFLMVGLCNVQWLLAVLVASGSWGYSVTPMMLLTLINWVFLKYYVCTGGFGHMLSANHNPNFQRRTSDIANKATYYLQIPQLFLGCGLANYIVYYSYWSTFGWSYANEPYLVAPAGVIIWHVLISVSCMFWESSVFVFYEIFILMTDAHVQELNNLSKAVRTRSINAYDAVEWHKGIVIDLKTSSDRYQWIAAFYVIFLLVSIGFYAAFGVTRAGANPLQVGIAAALLTFEAFMLFMVLFPAALVTAAASQLADEAAHACAGMFAMRARILATPRRPGGGEGDRRHDRSQGEREGGSDGRWHRDDDEDPRILSSRASSVRREMGSHLSQLSRHASRAHRLYKRGAAALEEADDEHHETAAAGGVEEWTTEESTFFLTYLRSVNAGFMILGRNITHALNLNLIYIAASVIFVFSRLNG